MYLRINNAQVWTGAKLEQVSILINQGKVWGLVDPQADDPFIDTEVLDANGLWILPGGVDLHVHISDGAETFTPGSMCAAAGGITTVLDMAPFHGCITPQQYLQKVESAARNCVVDFGLVAGIVVEEADLEFLPELMQLGSAYFKVFMPGRPPVTPELLWKAAKTAAQTGLRMAVHAEEPGCLDKDVDWSQPLGFPHSRPPAAETSACAQILEMARASGAPVHICHVSVAQTVELIARAKSVGVDVTAEVPPHFLLLEEAEFVTQGARVKTTPPLRTASDNRALWQGLADGILDAVACDHFLGSEEQVPKSVAHLQAAAAGIASLELSLPLLFSYGVQSGEISLKRFVDVTAKRPAEIAGLHHRKGALQIGADADLVFFDPHNDWRVAPQGDFSRNASSPYLDRNLSGRVVRTMLRGKTVWDGKNIVVAAGWGVHQPSHHKK